MKLSVREIVIPEHEENEVTSHRVFKPYKVVDKEGNFLFDEQGIFSEKIFGRFKKCKCGELHRDGICQKCNTRVVNRKKLPLFYIKFNNLEIPNLYINADKKVKDLLNYNAFLYNGEVIPFNANTIEEYDERYVLIGRKAVEYLGYKDVESLVGNKLLVPHTSIRKIQRTVDGYVLGYLNTLYVDLLKKKNKLDKFTYEEIDDVFLELMIKRKMMEYITNIREEIISILTQGKKSVVAKELRGQKLVGSIRAVVVNNYSLNEDTVLIGKYFIPYLYPTISEKFKTDEGYDIKGLNEYLKDYYVLLNRQPSISALSIIGMRPQFSDEEDCQYVMQINPIIMDGLAGDFDGDTLLLIALYSKLANEDAKKLLPSSNYMEVSNGTIRQAYPEDFEYTKTRLSLQ